MRFEGMMVPGAEWVEIVHIRQKDGSPLAEDNWRHKLFGRITLCWISGGLRKRGAFFMGKIRIKDGEIVEFNMDTERWTSTTTGHPVEVEPGVFDFETNTSIYRLRILRDDEEELIRAKFNEIAKARSATMSMAVSASADDGGMVS